MAVVSLAKFLFSIAVAAIVNVLYRMQRQRRRFKGLPQPPHSFLWGHLKIMGEAANMMPPNTHPQAYLTEIAQKYGLTDGIFYLDLWPVAESQVVITNADLANQVTVTKPLPIHPMAADFMRPMLGDNIIAAVNGPMWKRLHHAMSPAFSWNHVRNYNEVITDEVMVFRKILDQHCKSGEAFSMEETAVKLIFDVITRVVFNFPLNAQTNGTQTLDDLRELIALAEAQLSFNPLVKLRALFRKRRILERLHGHMESKINERFALLQSENVVPSRKDPYSVLDLMLREQLLETDLKGAETTPRKLTRADLDLLTTNIKGLLMGGSGTTNDTICFAYMLLSKHPAVLQKLRDEHTKVFGSCDDTPDVIRKSANKLNDLVYTTAVVHETLRLFPVGFGVRLAEESATVTHHEVTYPIGQGLVVIPTPHTIHYDSVYFKDPADFIPERFVEEGGVSRKAFRTFGRGPRACLGQNLAIDELRIILLLTAREYDLECYGLKPNEKPKTAATKMDTIFGDVVFQELGIEAKPRGRVMMKVKKRNVE